MRHKKGIRKLSRATDQRLALLKSLVAALFKHGKITTTFMRAKAAQRLAEKIITLAKKGNLHARRRAIAKVSDPEAVKLIFEEAPERFEGKPGGYTRVTRVGFRRGDNAPQAVLELI